MDETFRDPVELVGGPLDGELVETAGWTDQERAGGVALPASGCRWPGGRSLYGPAPGDPPHTRRWVWESDMP